jgi:outer membrane PBP1 activator LpoA protein
MLAKPAQARLIKPLLDFYYAGDLPVYSTSRIYGGYAAAATQRDDLDKVRFTEMPWVLQQSELKQRILTAQPASRNYLRLYAMGIDSFGLSSRLSQLKASTSPVQAQTGSLSVDAQNIVQRQSRLAEIRNGAAIAADETP